MSLHSILIVFFIVGLISYVGIRVIRRLYYSPLSQFPGPRLAALTHWVEVYYDIFAGGQFTFKIKEWHEEYGPIIRISPNEIHISDPNFFEIAYAANAPFDKLHKFQYRFDAPENMVSTVTHELHRTRKAALLPLMSRKSIVEFAPQIQEQTNTLCDRLLREFKGTSKAVRVDDACAALATDVIFCYTFGWDYGFLRAANFVSPFTAAMQAWAMSVHVMVHLPFVRNLIGLTPEWLMLRLNPDFQALINYRKEVESQILKFQSEENHSIGTTVHRTMLEGLASSKLPPHEKTVNRLQQELGGLVGAAIQTTKEILTTAIYHVLVNPAILDKLQAELSAAPRGKTQSQPSLTDLERLPYLSAVIKEALRVGNGVAQRLPRTSRDPLQYQSYTIPAGTAFSMSPYIQHNTEAVFSEPRQFRPERWLSDPKVTLGVGKEPKPLDRYLVPFSKGTRICTGQHVAMAELYIVLATLFSRVDMRLFETTLQDVESAREYLVALPAAGTNGVRVNIL